MRGNKPRDPKVSDPDQGQAEGEVRSLYPPAPEWITDPLAIEEWKRLIPDLIRRKKFLHLFQTQLAQFCISHGLYVRAAQAITVGRGRAKGQLKSVVKSSKGVEMMSQHLFVMNRQHEIMAKLAGDLGLNPVAYQRIENLQLDLFGERDAPKPSGDGDSGVVTGTAFGASRRAT